MARLSPGSAFKPVIIESSRAHRLQPKPGPVLLRVQLSKTTIARLLRLFIATFILTEGKIFCGGHDPNSSEFVTLQLSEGSRDVSVATRYDTPQLGVIAQRAREICFGYWATRLLLLTVQARY